MITELILGLQQKLLGRDYSVQGRLSTEQKHQNKKLERGTKDETE